MARKLFKLVGEISVNGIKELNKGLTEIDKKAVRLGRQIDRTGKKITRMGATLTKNLTLPIVAAGFAINKTIDAASDLGETAAKVGEIFGDSAKDIEAWSKTTADTMGQSQQQAQDAAATFAIFAKSAGLGGKELVDFSTDFTALASDMASFFNTRPDEAITAIGAAFRGESEPIRRYGVLLDAVTLKNKALEMGIISTTKKALTPQQRVLAAGAVIMEQTATAQGDFARTSDQLANKTRILEARMKNLSVEFGKVFLPIKLKLTELIMNKFLPAIEKVVDWFSKLSPEVIETGVAIAAVVATAGPFLVILGKLVSAFKLLAPAIVTVNTLLMANPWVAAAVAVGALTFAIIKLDKKAKGVEASNKRAIAIIDETKALKELRQEYQDTATRLQHVKDTGGPFNAEMNDQLIQARNNIESINEQLAQGKKIIEETPVPGTGEKAKGGGDGEAKKKKATEAEIARLKELKEKREQFENEWSSKLFAEIATREQYLEDEKQKQLIIAGDSAQARADIEQFYSIEFAKLEEEKTEKYEQELDNRIRIKKDAAEEIANIDLQISALEDELANMQAERNRTGIQMAIDGVYQLAAIINQAFINRMIDIDNETAKKKQAIADSVLSEKEKNQKFEALDKEAAAKKKEISKKQALLDKAIALFQIGINTAAAIMKGYADLGPVGGTVAAILIGLLGIAQTAVVATEPIPAKEGLFVRGAKGGVIAEVGEGRDDEIIMPMKTGVQVLADALIDKLSSIELPQFAPPQVAFAGAGGGMVSGGRGNDVHLHIGTLVADDEGLKSLEQRLLQFRVSNEMRKGRER